MTTELPEVLKQSEQEVAATLRALLDGGSIDEIGAMIEAYIASKRSAVAALAFKYQDCPDIYAWAPYIDHHGYGITRPGDLLAVNIHGLVKPFQFVLMRSCRLSIEGDLCVYICTADEGSIFHKLADKRCPLNGPAAMFFYPQAEARFDVVSLSDLRALARVVGSAAPDNEFQPLDMWDPPEPLRPMILNATLAGHPMPLQCFDKGALLIDAFPIPPEGSEAVH